MRLSPQDFRYDFRQGEEGEELELKVRRPSLRPTDGALELLRHNIAHSLALGICQIRRIAPEYRPRGGPAAILDIPLSDEHLPNRATVLKRVKEVIARISRALKVVSPRHLKPKRSKRTKPRNHPLPRLTRMRTGYSGLSI